MTVSRGHLAFHGAYVLLNLAFFCLAVPRLREIIIGLYGERCGHFGFWCTALGVAGKSLAFAVAGVLQSYLERYEDQPYMVAQPPIRFWMAIAAIHGLVAIVGLVVTIWHLLTLRPATEGQAGRLRTA